MINNKVDLKELIEKANQGDREAALELGFMYCYGYGVEKNYDEGFKYYSISENKDMLGECYLRGWGVERDVDKAIELWEEVALEDVFVGERLAYLYSGEYNHTKGIKLDYEKAFSLWQHYAQNGWSTSTYELARCYYEGRGVEKNITKALQLFESAIELFYDSYNPDSEEVLDIAEEPLYIADSRRILVKHGCTNQITYLKRFAEAGDIKPGEILQEFNIDFTSLNEQNSR